MFVYNDFFCLQVLSAFYQLFFLILEECSSGNNYQGALSELRSLGSSVRYLVLTQNVLAT